MRSSDWSSDVCSSDLGEATHHRFEGDEPDFVAGKLDEARQRGRQHQKLADQFAAPLRLQVEHKAEALVRHERKGMRRIDRLRRQHRKNLHRSEEHTSELPSLMRISYAVFFLKK